MWTKEKPTVDGWYWFRPADEQSKLEGLAWPIEVFGGMMFEDAIQMPENVEGEYQGPIKPEET